jgi:8-oxo-dGTP diphosphatase
MDIHGEVTSSNASRALTEVQAGAAVWLEVAVAVVYRRHAGAIELLIARRHAAAIRGGLWEFPGGKIEQGEAATAAALREVEEEVGLGAGDVLGPPEPLVVVEDFDPDQVREKGVRLRSFLVEARPEAKAQALGSGEVRWVGVTDLDRFEWPKANAAIIAAVRARLGPV